MSETTIFDAVQAGDAARVRDLLAADPALTAACDENGLTPLVVALYHRRTEVRDAILAAQPELHLFEAAAVGRPERVRELLDGDPALLASASPDGYSPLQFAAFFGQPACVELLLERGASTSAVAANPMGVRALNAAAAGGNADVVRMLLQAGADVASRMSGGYTPLHSAAANGRVDLVELLLAAGAPTDARNDDGRTPAELAAEHGHADLASRLADSG